MDLLRQLWILLNSSESKPEWPWSCRIIVSINRLGGEPLFIPLMTFNRALTWSRLPPIIVPVGREHELAGWYYLPNWPFNSLCILGFLLCIINPTRVTEFGATCLDHKFVCCKIKTVIIKTHVPRLFPANTPHWTMEKSVSEPTVYSFLDDNYLKQMRKKKNWWSVLCGPILTMIL